MEIIKNKFSNYNVVSWLGYALVGALLFFGISHRIINFWELPALWMLLTFALFTPLVTVFFAYVAVGLLPRLAQISKDRLLLLLLLLLLTVVVSSLITWRFYRAPEVFQVLTIAPLEGDVRLIELKRDLTVVSLSEAAFESRWHEEGGTYLAVSDSQPLKFIFKSPANRPMSVLFLTSPEGGKVELTLNRQAARQVDLTSNLPGQTRLDFSTDYRGIPGELFSVFLVFVDILTFGLFILAILFLPKIIRISQSDSGQAMFLQRYAFNAWYVLAGLLLIVCLMLTADLNQKLTESPNTDDSQHRIIIAYNLAYQGQFSLNLGDLRPTNYREPLPIWFTAGWIALHPELRSGLHHPRAEESPSINEGNAVRLVKQSNLFWAFLTLFGVGVTVLIVLKKHSKLSLLGAFLAVYLTFMFFVSRGGFIDRMQNEIHTGALIVWSSLFLFLALSRDRYLWFSCAGTAMGLLALTNASFLYINFVAVGFLFALYFWRPSQKGWNWKVIPSFMALIAAFIITVLPWMTRNYLLFDSFSISQRGSHVLNARAIKNQMDIPGGFYHYAPGDIRAPLGELLGYSDQDLEFGGRLQGLNRSGNASFVESDDQAASLGHPEDVISYRKKARAEMVFWKDYFLAKGEVNTTTLAEQEIKRIAIQRILTSPGRHLAVSFVFLWRGMWSMGSAKLDLLLNGASFVSLLGLFFVGTWKRNPSFLGISTISFLAFGFYAGLTHFIPRYSSPMIPSMIISFVIAGILCIAWLQKILAAKLGVCQTGD